MASDIPEAHRNPDAMARCLVAYIADPERVRREVRAVFGTSPCVYTIRQMRERRFRAVANGGYDPAECYRSLAASEAANDANTRFLARLRFAHPERFVA